MPLPLFLAPFIAPVIATIGWAVRIAVPALLSQVFIGMLVRVGLVVAFFIGMNVAVGTLMAQASGYLGGLPGDLLGLMTATGMINAMNIIASAYLFKLTLKIDSVKLLSSHQ